MVQPRVWPLAGGLLLVLAACGSGGDGAEFSPVQSGTGAGSGTGGTSASATGGTTAATGGASTGTGGATSQTGGASAAGGASASGGVGTGSGGTLSTGGTTVTTGGAGMGGFTPAGGTAGLGGAPTDLVVGGLVTPQCLTCAHAQCQDSLAACVADPVCYEAYRCLATCSLVACAQCIFGAASNAQFAAFQDCTAASCNNLCPAASTGG